MRISVVTAVYNSKDTIRDALESILAQSYGEVETVVIDGASTDGTGDIVEGYRDRLGVCLSEPDRGIYDALNKGIRLSTGDVIGFLHSDDLFAQKDVLSRVAAVFEDASVDAIYGDLTYVREDDPQRVVRYWRAGSFSQGLLAKGWMPPHPTVYIRRSCYERIGLFDTSYRIAADYDLMLRLLGTKGLEVRYLPEVLVKMRVGGASNRSLKNILLKSREDFRALRRNKVGGLGSLVLKNLSKLPQFLN